MTRTSRLDDGEEATMRRISLLGIDDDEGEEANAVAYARCRTPALLARHGRGRRRVLVSSHSCRRRTQLAMAAGAAASLSAAKADATAPSLPWSWPTSPWLRLRHQ